MRSFAGLHVVTIMTMRTQHAAATAHAGEKDQVHFLGVEKMNLTQFSLEVR
jgi:hypothetical protein